MALCGGTSMDTAVGIEKIVLAFTRHTDDQQGAEEEEEEEEEIHPTPGRETDRMSRERDIPVIRN